MINLASLFRRNGYLIKPSKEETSLLTFFLHHKADFELWFQQSSHNYPKIRFAFYYPSAIDFFYDEHKLFTAYFNKEANGDIVFTQLKMSQLNHTTLKTSSWKPFKEVMIQYLTVVEQRNNDLYLQKQKSLHEYQTLCGEGTQLAPERSTYSKEQLTPDMLLQ